LKNLKPARLSPAKFKKSLPSDNVAIVGMKNPKSKILMATKMNNSFKTSTQVF
jgi:hypothetical protein